MTDITPIPVGVLMDNQDLQRQISKLINRKDRLCKIIKKNIDLRIQHIKEIDSLKKENQNLKKKLTEHKNKK